MVDGYLRVHRFNVSQSLENEPVGINIFIKKIIYVSFSLIKLDESVNWNTFLVVVVHFFLKYYIIYIESMESNTENLRNKY